MMESAFQVVLRCRPLTTTGRDTAVSFSPRDQKRVTVLHEDGASRRDPVSSVFTFDAVYEGSTHDLYAGCVEPLVKDVRAGYNATVMCYGQTGSGKTYTIEGPAGRRGDATAAAMTAAATGSSFPSHHRSRLSLSKSSTGSERGILPRIFQ